MPNMLGPSQGSYLLFLYIYILFIYIIIIKIKVKINTRSIRDAETVEHSFDLLGFFP